MFIKYWMNLFTEWKNGNLVGPKIYLIRIHYINPSGEAFTCLKLGFTGQPLHQRIINLLGSMRKATGLIITSYELIGIVPTPNYSQIEYALHHQVEHQYFYPECGELIRFIGFTEILKDTPANIELLQIPYFIVSNGNQIRPYHPRVNKRRSSKYVLDTGNLV